MWKQSRAASSLGVKHDFPTSKKEAKSHIEEIRREKGLDGPEANTADLERALVLLSSQLYEKDTHFLLELIQNADDNDYADDKEPSVAIMCRDGRIQIACNEVGFRRRNVQSLCRVGDSTKKKEEDLNASRYIGEKGIGFKSVFKVANVVWINSGFYAFKFDQRERLGMIAPTWSDTPIRTPEGYSSITLELLPGYDDTELVRELQSFDPKLLLFLRKLRKLHISITRGSGPTWTQTLVKTSDSKSENGSQVFSITHDGQTMKYIVVSHEVAGMPSEEKRPDCSSSEILLAFPFSQSEEPVSTRSQSVYAFLPIRDYGFRFLIQGDFLLTASRGEIETSSPWNKALRDNLPSAILRATKILGQSALGYTWPLYFQPRPHMSDFFEPLEKAYVQLLANYPVLAAENGQMTIPSQLTMVPLELLDDDGLPLTLCPTTSLCTGGTSSKYLSSKYSRDFASFFRLLGVKELTIEAFFADLQLCLKEPSFLAEKKALWHSAFAKRMISLLGQNRSWAGTLRRLPIVMLKDGTWGAAKDRPLVFPCRKSDLTVPNGLNINEVHMEAYGDVHRRNLLVWLGANQFSAETICDIIATSHAGEQPPLRRGVTSDDLVDQAIFVFRTVRGVHKNLDRCRPLWLLNGNGTFQLGDELYLPRPHRHLSSSSLAIMDQFGTTLHCVDEIYWARVPEETWSKWESWLHNDQSVNRLPRLTAGGCGPKLLLSQEMRHAVHQWNGLQFLYMLKVFWADYEKSFVGRNARYDLAADIRSITVPCRGGGSAKLSEVVLPSKEITHKTAVAFGLHVLDLPSCTGSEWDFLKLFGVGQRDVVGHLLEKLREKQETRQESAEMTSLYQGLAEAATSSDKRQRIRREFANNPLVYLPPGGDAPDGSWLKLEDCVWSTLDCLQKTPQLEKIYPSLSNLFRDILDIPNAGISSVIAEIAKVRETDTLRYITDLFVVLGLYTALDANCVDTVRDTLGHLKCLPIAATEAEDTFDSLDGFEARSVWFIADQPHLRSSFAGTIPLLAFSVNDIGRVMPLLRLLLPSLEDRKLSKIAKGIPAVRGATTYHAEYTKSLRAKAKFIFSLAPDQDKEKRSKVRKQLFAVEVWETEQVVVEWSVQVSPGTVLQGRADAGKVKVSAESGTLRVYMMKDDLVAPSPPLELGEELCKHCEIAGADKGMLLQHILMTSDFEAIRHLLSRRGLVVEDDDDVAKALLQAGLSVKDHAHVVSKAKKKPAENQTKPPTQDYEALTRFIEGIEEVASMQKILEKRWEQHRESQMNGILSRVCREARQDASVLLPRDQLQTLRHQRRNAFDRHTTEYWYRAVTNRTIAEIEARASYMCPSISYTVDGEQMVVKSALAIHPIDQDTLLVAELTISKLFEESLGPWYSPSKHWTSPRACMEGGAALLRSDWDSDNPKPATFTITEEDDSFRDLLARFGKRPRKTWERPTTFHVEVVLSQDEAAAGAEILINGRLMSSALRYHAQARTGELTDNVFVLIVLSSVFESPKICIKLDPWESILTGEIGLVTSHPVFLSLADGCSSYDLSLLPRIERPIPDKSSEKKSRNGIFWKKRSRASVLSSATSESSAPTPSHKDTYLYRPLKKTRDIRLLKLEPGRGSDELVGMIFHTSLDDLGGIEFQAMSYRWGPNLKPKGIGTPDGRLDITLSLWKALLSIRDAEAPQTVWADAICINQADNMEKSIQIRLMSQVFQAASKVYAWLGEEADDSAQAMQALLRIRTWDLRDTSTNAGSMPATWKAEGVPPKDDKVIPAIKLLLARKYFRRAWIIQELVLAKKVVVACGSWTMSLDDMFEALRICRAKGLFLAETNTDRGARTDVYAAYVLGLTRKLFEDPLRRKKYGLLTLLEVFSYSDCGMTRDKLFALLALASDVDNSAFNPDYEAPLDETVFRRYANVFVANGKAAELLVRAGAGSKSYDFCSWIPCWTRKDFPATISTWSGREGRFKAAGDTPVDCTVVQRPSGDQLRARAVLFDKIKTVGDVTIRSSNTITYLNSIRQSIKTLHNYPTGERISELLQRIPIGTASRPHLDEPVSMQSAFASLTGEDSSMLNEAGVSDPFDPDARIPEVNSLDKMFQELKKEQAGGAGGGGSDKKHTWRYWHTAVAFAVRLSNARFCTTERGYAGLVPFDACVGADIAIVHGVNTPLVLRSRGRGEEGEGKDCYDLIGECYIHGIMYGEALKEEEEESERYVHIV